MLGFHHGVSANELTQGVLPMRNADMSVIGLVAISETADDTHYPKDTPVLLTGITQTDIDKAGTDGTLSAALRSIRNIVNPKIVVLRLSDKNNPELLEALLSTKARLGVVPKILGAPLIDTPAIVRKLVSIAARRRGFVYASPRREDGALIIKKEEIVSYRKTFGVRELMLIENAWGEEPTLPAHAQPTAEDTEPTESVTLATQPAHAQPTAEASDTPSASYINLN